MNITLNTTDFAALSPLLIVLFGSLMVLLLETFAENASKRFSIFLTSGTFIAAMIATIYAPISTSPLLTPWLKFDSFSQFFTFFFLVIGLFTTLLSDSFFRRFTASAGEFYFLLLASVFGLILIGAAADFLTIFLGLETLSIALYIWCGYMKSWSISREASVKYFLIGAIATAFLIYGIALIYGATGTTRLDVLLSAYQGLATGADKTLFLAGIAMLTLGLAFKAAIVPFHFWAPDVYAGASNPVTAFMAIGTKAGAFAAFARIFLVALPAFNLQWNEAISFLAYPTLIYANFLALQQVQLRRFFAYSGISHAGFLLIPLAAGTPDSLSVIQFYLVIYSLATFGCFAVLSYLDDKEEGVTLPDLAGLFKRSPWLASIFALCLLTLAGIPPTAGFFAKFFVFKVAFEAGYYGLVIVGLLTAILSAYYYLRIAATMFGYSDKKESLPRLKAAGFVAIVSVAAIVFLSIYPALIYRS
jgi:NADH-quinone oxidoreductase subunit N